MSDTFAPPRRFLLQRGFENGRPSPSYYPERRVDSCHIVEYHVDMEVLMDACYLELAQRLNLPLLTFDTNMTRAGKDLGIRILGGKNVGV